MTSDLLEVGLAIVGTTVMGVRSLWVATEARDDLARTNARLNDAIRTINKRFAAQSDRINAIDREDSHPENISPPMQPEGPYRTRSADSTPEEDSPPEIAKAFVSGQKVDVAFLDDGEPKDSPHLRFSAVFVHFSKDANGKTQVWLRCGEGEPEPYILANVYLMHPGEDR